MEQQLTIDLKAAVPKISISKSSTLKMFIDGASRGNPGFSGAGIYIEHNNTKFLAKGFFLGKKTNNQAEYLALTLGAFFLKKALTKLDSIPSNIEIISDSELLVKQMNKEYKVKDIILKLLQKMSLAILGDIKLKNIIFKHVLRDENKKADKLANMGIDKKNIVPKEFVKILHENNIDIL